MIEGHVDQLTAVHQAQVVSTAGQGDRVAREGVEGDEQPDLCAARSQSPHELLHVGPADRVERPLALDLGDRWLQAQRIPVGDDVDAAVAAGGGHLGAVAHRLEQPGGEHLEAVGVELGVQRLDDEVAGVGRDAVRTRLVLSGLGDGRVRTACGGAARSRFDLLADGRGPSGVAIGPGPQGGDHGAEGDDCGDDVVRQSEWSQHDLGQKVQRGQDIDGAHRRDQQVEDDPARSMSSSPASKPPSPR